MAPALQLGPLDHILVFVDPPLLRAPAARDGVELLRMPFQVGDDEADGREQFPREPLHLGLHPAGTYRDNLRILIAHGKPVEKAER
jgi:hypothetical protein